MDDPVGAIWELEQLRKLTDGEPAQRAQKVTVPQVALELGPLDAMGVPTDAETCFISGLAGEGMGNGLTLHWESGRLAMQSHRCGGADCESNHW